MANNVTIAAVAARLDRPLFYKATEIIAAI